MSLEHNSGLKVLTLYYVDMKAYCIVGNDPSTLQLTRKLLTMEEQSSQYQTCMNAFIVSVDNYNAILMEASLISWLDFSFCFRCSIKSSWINCNNYNLMKELQTGRRSKISLIHLDQTSFMQFIKMHTTIVCFIHQWPDGKSN